MIKEEIDITTYILYAGSDDRIKEVVVDIKKYIKETLRLEAFDYQDKNLHIQDERHRRITTLNEAIAESNAIVLNLDKNYLESMFCLDELYGIAKRPSKEIQERVVCIVHDQDIIKGIYEDTIKARNNLMNTIEATIQAYKYKKDNDLTRKEKRKLDSYAGVIQDLFDAFKNLRYSLKEPHNLNEIQQDIEELTKSFQDYLKERRRKLYKRIGYAIGSIILILGTIYFQGNKIRDKVETEANKTRGEMKNEYDGLKEGQKKILSAVQDNEKGIDPQTFNKEVRTKIKKAKEYQADGNFLEAIEIYKNILEKESFLAETNRIDIYKEMINCARESKLYDDMENYINTLIGYIKANGAKKYKKSLAWAYMQKGEMYYHKNNSKKAIEYFKKAQDEYTDEEDKAWALSWIGDTYYYKMSDYKDANKIYTKSLQKYLDQNISQDKRVAYLYSKIGYSKKKLSNFNDAIENMNQAITIYENINKNNKYSSKIAWCYDVLGFVYDKKPDSNPSAALENYKKSCAYGHNWGCHDVGVFYRDGRGIDKNLSTALQYYNKSCELKLGKACSESGYIYESNSSIENHMDLALDKYEQACQLQDSWACNKLGYLFRDGKYWQITQDYPKAKKYFTQACDNNYSSACIGVGLMCERGQSDDANHTMALQYYKKACKLKNAWGCYDAGLNYQYGRGAKINYELAKNYYLKAKKMGHPKAANRLSILINHVDESIETEKKIDINKQLCQEGTPLSCSWLGEYFEAKNPERSKYFYKKFIEIFSKKCENGDGKACDLFASIYYYGVGVVKDMQNFLKIANKNCDRNLPVSCALLSIYYFNNSKDTNIIKKYQDKAYNNCKGDDCWECGVGFEINDKTSKLALKFYNKACRDNVKKACFAMATNYKDGIGVNRNIKKAIEYLLPLAKNGFGDAREKLADIYYDMEDSYKSEAFKWYKLAAQKDRGWSEYKLGYMFEYAEGTPRDINQSIYWYKKSIVDGILNGAENLADIYYEQKKYNLSFHYYKLTVDNNVSDRNYALGYMYEYGEGIDKDLHLAFLHYEKSAKNGISASQCRLAKAYKTGDLVNKDIDKSKYWMGLFNENNDTEKGKCILDCTCEESGESLQNIIHSNQESRFQIEELRKEIGKMIISTEIINPSEN